MRFTLVDKAYYVAEYLKELEEDELLQPRTVCERYKHTRRGEMGLEIEPDTIIAWADEITAALEKRKSKVERV